MLRFKHYHDHQDTRAVISHLESLQPGSPEQAMSGDTFPHFTTLAKRFNSHAEVEDLFEQIRVCHEQDVLGNELFATDGCNMSSEVSKGWSGALMEPDHFPKTNRPWMGRGRRNKEVKRNLTDNANARITDVWLTQNLCSLLPFVSDLPKGTSRVITA